MLNTSARKEHMIELFTTIEILNNSIRFIGSYTSNIARYLYMRNPSLCSIIDIDKEIANL